jgi:hypothetical protein
MSKSSQPSPPSGGQFLVYQTQDGKLKLDVRFQGESVWLTQQHMAALFQTSVPNISMHIRNVFTEGELTASSVVKESLTTAADSKNYATKFYNLDVIISVGYRVSHSRWRLKNDSHARFAQDAKTRRFEDQEEKPLSRFLPLRLRVFA